MWQPLPKSKDAGPKGPSRQEVEDLRQQMADLQRRLKDIQNNQANDQGDLDYKLETMSNARDWQIALEDNLDASHPLTFRVWISPDTVEVDMALMHLAMMDFRSYSEVTLSYFEYPLYGVSETAEWLLTTDANSTKPATASISGITGSGGADFHNHSFSGSDSHSHPLYEHNHSFLLPQHTHVLSQGIYSGSTPTDARVSVNGTDVTTELGGPWNTDVSLDLRQYMLAQGWNTITVSAFGLGRIHATLAFETYIRRGGNR